jgi:ribosomal protein S18 acetylase RimI-like enzyme
MVKIRYGERKDIPSIVDFQQKMAWETEKLKLDFDILTQGVHAVFEDAKKGQYIIAESDGEVIASMMLTPEWSDWRNTNFLWIQSVYVITEFRQKGVFRKMFGFAKQIVEGSPAYSGLRLYVEVNNTAAQKVYIHTGMDGEHYKMFGWEKPVASG